MHESSYNLWTNKIFSESELGARIVFIILKTENNLKKIFYKFYRNTHQYFSNM